MNAPDVLSIHLHGLRNFSNRAFDFSPGLNIIEGNNGCGKTTLLEAIYLLSTGHSFRTRETQPIITNGLSEAIVFARCSEQVTISICKSKSIPTIAKINQQPCLSSSELARLLPTQVLHQGLFQILEAGASIRRQILDWGLFHVKHDYHVIWKQYRRILLQRNALLKRQTSRSELEPWNIQLAEVGEQINKLREHYFNRLKSEYNHNLPKLTDCECDISYYKGWDKSCHGKGLLDILNDNYANDIKRATTSYGIHQADIVFSGNDGKAKLTLSRGQQKMVLLALKISQGNLLNSKTIFLFDDLFAELDREHSQRAIDCIMNMSGQSFLTCPVSFNLTIAKVSTEATSIRL